MNVCKCVCTRVCPKRGCPKIDFAPKHKYSPKRGMFFLRGYNFASMYPLFATNIVDQKELGISLPESTLATCFKTVIVRN